jgi:hypothetical protein
MKYVDLVDIFSSVGFNCVSQEKIDIDSLNKFIDTWNLIKQDKPELKIPFLELVKELLNEMVRVHRNDNLDNPFNTELPF